jgi:8-oxo-(d)GTP phosphatase
VRGGRPRDHSQVQVHLIRHADALSRKGFDQPDEYRPLSDRGRDQARGLADRRWSSVVDVLSSPAIRCATTVAPLAARNGLTVESRPELAEGADPALALNMIEEGDFAGDIVVCSHGDLIPEMLHLFELRGCTLVGPSMVDKASTWTVEFQGGVAETATYVAPPVLPD